MPGRQSDRFASRAAKELRRELLVSPLPELGLVAANGPLTFAADVTKRALAERQVEAQAFEREQLVVAAVVEITR